MNFNNLRQGSAVYIIHKGGKPRLEVGEVLTKSDPHYNIKNTSVAYGTNIPQVVDITVKAGEQVLPFGNLNASDSGVSCNGGAMYLASSTEVALQEVDRMMAESKAALERVDYHRGVLECGEVMLEQLNPRYKEEKAQKLDISNLKGQVGDITSRVNDIDSKLDEMMDIMHDLRKMKPKN